MSIRPLLISLGASVALFSIAQAEEPFYPELLCSDFLTMDSAEQEKAINWLNGDVANGDLKALGDLVAKPFSVTIDACEKTPDSKVIDIIKHEPH